MRPQGKTLEVARSFGSSATSGEWSMKDNSRGAKRPATVCEPKVELFQVCRQQCVLFCCLLEFAVVSILASCIWSEARGGRNQLQTLINCAGERVYRDDVHQAAWPGQPRINCPDQLRNVVRRKDGPLSSVPHQDGRQFWTPQRQPNSSTSIVTTPQIVRAIVKPAPWTFFR